MTLGDKLVISAYKTKNFSELTKIRTEWLDEKEKALYDFSRDYYAKNAVLPPQKLLSTHFKDPSLMGDVEGMPNYYVKQLKERFIKTELSLKLPKKLRRMSLDPVKVLSEIKDICTNAGIDVSDIPIERYAGTPSSRYADYVSRKGTKGITYLSTGDDILDSMFYGYKRGDLITIAARAGVGKTWFLCMLALMVEAESHIKTGGKDILIVSNEMSSEELFMRLDAIAFELPYSDLIKSELSELDEKRYKKSLEELRSNIVVLPKISEVAALDEHITMFDPSIVFVDGSYLMEARSGLPTWERIQRITQGLKSSALKNKIPIINTTQLKRGTGKKSGEYSLDAQEDFAFGGSFIQDSDVGINLAQDALMKYNNVVEGRFSKLRRANVEQSFEWGMNIDTMKFSINEPSDYFEEESDVF